MSEQNTYTGIPTEPSEAVKQKLREHTFDNLEARTLKDVLKRYQIGIYVSIIINMLVVIFLLMYKISDVTGNAPTTQIALNLEDYAPLMEKEKTPEEKQLEDKEKLEAQVNDMLRNARQTTTTRNAVVNTDDKSTSTLKDAKGINNAVYDEAQQLQDKLDAGRKRMEELQQPENAVPVRADIKPATTQTYQGPSVLSYSLAGRKAIRMPIPAYKCERGGDVAVTIWVNKNGYVVDAEIDVHRSVSDPALHAAALEAAKSSRFTANPAAADKQEGVIVYRFVAQ